MSASPAIRVDQANGSVRDPILQLLLMMSARRRLSILGYHRVLAEPDPLNPSDPTAEEFESRMRWLKVNFNVISLEEGVRGLLDSRLAPRAVAITFDDGYADNYTVALPILRKLGLPACIFIATGFLNGGCMFNDVVVEAIRHADAPGIDLNDLGLGHDPLGSDEERRVALDRILRTLKYFEIERRDAVALEIARRAGARVPRDIMMTTAQVRALHAAGMSIGAHTVNHPILARTSSTSARREMAAARTSLEAITGAPVRLFAYPNGHPGRDYGPHHAALARELGFRAAVSTAWGAARPGDDVFQLPRFTPWDRPHWRFGLRLARSRLQSGYARA